MKLLKHPWFIATFCALFVFAVALVSLTVTANELAKSELIAPNTWVGNVRLDNMNELGAINAIRAHYGNFQQGKLIHLQSGTVIKTIPLESFFESFLIDSTVNSAMENGKTGSWAERVWQCAKRPFVRTVLPLQWTFSSKIIDDVQEFAEAVDERYSTYTINEEAKTLTINVSTVENMVDTAATLKSIVDCLAAGTPEAIKTIRAGSGSRAVARLLHERLARDPQDSTVSTENKELVFIPEKNGIEFDVIALRKALSSGSSTVVIPITVISAEITEEHLRQQLFKDVLAEYTTKYAMDGSRSKNVRTASGNVNGTLLLPEQTFSFNEIVGERTFAAGFTMAHVYAGGRIVDGVGGGICQVSTTIYSAVLMADLEVVERHNHSFTIGYAPLGQDATVSFGTLDFVFANNTGYPLIIETEDGYGTLTVRILGTNPHPEKTVELMHQTIASKAFPVVEKPNPDASATKRIIEQSGMTGYTVDSYKVYKVNDVEVERVFLHRSVYQTLAQIVLIPQEAMPPTEQTPPPIFPPTDVQVGPIEDT